MVHMVGSRQEFGQQFMIRLPVCDLSMKQTVSTVFDDLGVGIMLHDPETGEIVGVNDRLTELYGYSAAELREMDVHEYSAVDEGHTQVEAEKRILAAADGDPQEFEWRVERADGERIWVNVRTTLTTLDGEAYVIAKIKDISNRKQQQEDLEAERGFIEQSLQTLNDAFYLLNTDGTLQRWNQTLSERTGYSDAELDGMQALELFPDDHQAAISKAITEVLDTGSGIVEAPLLTKDGEEIPHEFSGTTLTDDDGGLRGVIGIGRDISERQEQLNQLEKQEKAFRKLHQTASKSASFEEKIADLLAFGREFMDVEQGFLTSIDGDTQRIVVGVGPNEQLSDGAEAPFSESYCRHTVDPDRSGPLTVMNAAEEGWKDDPAYERFGLACYAGSEITVEGETMGTICFADRNPVDKEFTEIQETFVELLTEWASYELERAEREKKYRRLTERISDAYYAVDTEFTVTYWNDVVAERVGVPADEVLGENLWEHFPELEDTVVEAQFREAMDTQEPTSCEFHYDKHDYWTQLQIYPDEDGLAVISKDITDRKEYESQLERSNERLQEFAYILSHDLQEPLRMVSSYVCLLEEEFEDHLDEETQQYIDFAVDGAERMRGMIDGLLLYSRVETEGDERAKTNVDGVLDAVETDLELKLDETEANLIVDTMPTLQADEDQLVQLFQNLIKNAVEHGGRGTTVEVSSTEVDDGHRFAVSDDGPGIPPDQQDDIFRLFDKGGDSDGTGIGLAICERIVNRHNGDIWVESEPGEGTTFYFTIEDEYDD